MEPGVFFLIAFAKARPAGALLTLALSNSSFDASLGASAYAQSSQVRQFAVTIKKRKVAAGADVIRVTQGD